MINFIRVIAGNSDLLTAQAFVYQNSNLTLAFLVTASGEDVFTKVRLTATQIEEEFFTSQEQVPARLEKASQTALSQLGDYKDIQLEFFVWQENLLYISTHGNHHAFLLRDNQLTHLTPQDGHDQLISGHLKAGDRLLLLTNSFSKLEDQNILKKLAEIPLDQFDDEISSIWRQSQDIVNQEAPLPTKQPVAAILVDYHSDQLEKPIELENLSIKRSPKINLASIFSKTLNLLPKSLKVRAIILVILLLLASIPIGFALVEKSKQKQTEQINNLISISKDKLNQAQSFKDLDPAQAKANLNDAKTTINQALALAPNSKEAEALKKQIEDQTPSILKIKTIDNLPVFLSLDLIKPGFQSKEMSYSVGKILMLDETKKTLVTIDIETKTNQILAGQDQLGDAKIASLNGGFAFDFSEDKGIVRVDVKNQKSTQVIKPDQEWGKIKDIVGFGGNVYLLDILKNQIWKYIPTTTSYSDKVAYLKENKSLDFVSSKRMEIDASIWILDSNNLITKYTQGAKDNFSVHGLDKDLASVSTFFTSDTTDNIYLLDSGNSRLVILDKKGEYISQYQGDKFKTADDLIVDEKNKKIYLLEGNKIYIIDLK